MSSSIHIIIDDSDRTFFTLVKNFRNIKSSFVLWTMPINDNQKQIKSIELS